MCYIWHNISKGGIPLQVFPATCLKYCNFKTIFYKVNYNFSVNHLTFWKLA